MGRPWIPLIIIVVGAALGLAVAGLPSRGHDAPISVQALEATTTSPPSTSVSVPPSAPVSSSAPQVRPPGEVGVMVFNASGIPGSATRFGTTIKSRGWDLKAPGADRTAQDATVIMYRPGFEAEAQALATALGLDPSVITALDGSVAIPESADLGVLVGTVLARRSG